MLGRLLQIKSKTVTFGALLIAVASFLSGLLGILRDNLLANLFGLRQTDIYLAAFRIPDLVYAILITGGVVAAFLPIFSEYHVKGEKEAKLLTANVLFFFALSLIALCVVLFFLAPFLIKLMVPGFSLADQQEVVTLTRIMLLSPILLGISSIIAGVLQYFNLFLAFAIAPILYNVGIIVGILFLGPVFGLKGLAFGVVLGALLHLGVQLPIAIKKGFSFNFSAKLNWKHPGLIRIFKLMAPRTLGSAASQVNLLVITAVASTLSSGAISVLNYANNLQGFPITLIGISFATAVFPTLSRNFAQGEVPEFIKNFSSSFRQIFFLIFPISLLMFVLRNDIVRLVFGQSIFGHGRFGPEELNFVAAFLGIFSLVLFSSTLIPILVRAFFALRDTLTPVKVAFLAIFSNLILCWFFIWLFGRNLFCQNKLAVFLSIPLNNVPSLGLGLAVAITSLLQFFILAIWLRKKLVVFRPNVLKSGIPRIFMAGVLMALVVWLLWRFGFGVIAATGFWNLFIGLAGITIFGLFIYCLFCFLLKCDYPKVVWRSLTEQFKK